MNNFILNIKELKNIIKKMEEEGNMSITGNYYIDKSTFTPMKCIKLSNIPLRSDENIKYPPPTQYGVKFVKNI